MMITASIVLYKTSLDMLKQVISSYSPDKNRLLYLIDNSPDKNEEYQKLCNEYISYIFTGSNNGYGFGHNIAIKKAIEIDSKYHVVLNPDLRFDSSVIDKLFFYAESDESIGHLMPKITNPEGEIQYLCKLIPTPINLIFKRFLPQKITKKSNERFQLKFADYNKIMDVPYLSGCFMFFRVEALKKVGLFDERFFMYPEDIDITRRIHSYYRTVYYPLVSIVHDHAAESYHSKKMLKIHIQNMIKYFNKWGWIFDKERRQVNKRILKTLGYKK